MISIDYNTYVIFIPKADTQFVQTNPSTGLEVRQLNVETFGKALADLQDNIEGMWAPTAFEYTAPKDVGGILLAPVVLILPPYSVTFEDGQYAVNLIGGNTNLQDFVNVNQVSIRPSNSVGSTYSDAINEQSYQDASIWVDIDDGVAGTAYPIGTPTIPVNNPTDAFILIETLNLHRMKVKGTFIMPPNQDNTSHHIMGNTPVDSVIVMDNTNVNRSGYERVHASGSMVGRVCFRDSIIGNISGFDGAMEKCALTGNVTLSASSTEAIIFCDCISAIAGLSKPGLNCNSTAAGINVRRYAGGLAITNFNNVAGTMTLDLMGAEVSINSTNCTNGVIVARGVGKLVDENGVTIPTGTITINGNLLISNRLINADQVASSDTWSTQEKDAVLAYSKNASDNAEQANLKLI